MESRGYYFIESATSNVSFRDTKRHLVDDYLAESRRVHAKIRVRERSVHINAPRLIVRSDEIANINTSVCVCADRVRLMQSGLQLKVAHATIVQA